MGCQQCGWPRLGIPECSRGAALGDWDLVRMALLWSIPGASAQGTKRLGHPWGREQTIGEVPGAEPAVEVSMGRLLLTNPRAIDHLPALA